MNGARRRSRLERSVGKAAWSIGNGENSYRNYGDSDGVWGGRRPGWWRFIWLLSDLLAGRGRSDFGAAQYFFSTTDSAVTRSMVCDSGRRESTAPYSISSTSACEVRVPSTLSVSGSSWVEVNSTALA